jgi:hypothetical protein
VAEERRAAAGAGGGQVRDGWQRHRTAGATHLVRRHRRLHVPGEQRRRPHQGHLVARRPGRTLAQ